jgi:hypothetical protein
MSETGTGAPSPFVNPREFDTELAAVWFAANYYYEASFKRIREYAGIVFKKPNGKHGLTIRRDGRFDRIEIRFEDVPPGCDTRAVWHTHLPHSRLVEDKMFKFFLMFAEALEHKYFNGGLENFSGASGGDRGDIPLAEAATRAFKHPVSIYLITATLIKRYTPGLKTPEKEWRKEPPGRMKQIW